jgi:phosphoribosylformimino-5-aminoimidazole carboxamide ribotide isomerase
MRVYPAMDLYQGQCVRLKQGDFDQMTIYSKSAEKDCSPKDYLKKFEEMGFSHLHVVDLSGARNPENRQLNLIQELVAQSQLKIQVGGGIRSSVEIGQLIEMGVERVLLGSMAVQNRAETIELLKSFGGFKLTFAFDVFEDGKLATRGWSQKEQSTIYDLLPIYIPFGLNRVLCTDISRDGTLRGPNLKLYEGLVRDFPNVEFQASGGVRSDQDLSSLRATGVHSVIVGKAIYESGLLGLLGETTLAAVRSP